MPAFVAAVRPGAREAEAMRIGGSAGRDTKALEGEACDPKLVSKDVGVGETRRTGSLELPLITFQPIGARRQKPRRSSAVDGRLKRA
jgi:hypothetical protein